MSGCVALALTVRVASPCDVLGKTPDGFEHEPAGEPV